MNSELNDGLIHVEVAYAKASEQKIISLEVAKGTSLLDAAKQSGIADCFPEIELDRAKLGLFGKMVSMPSDQEVVSGDRIEIYRPLIADPKEIRKKRVEQAKLQKQNN